MVPWSKPESDEANRNQGFTAHEINQLFFSITVDRLIFVALKYDQLRSHSRPPIGSIQMQLPEANSKLSRYIKYTTLCIWILQNTC